MQKALQEAQICTAARVRPFLELLEQPLLSPTLEHLREVAKISVDRLVTGIRRKDPGSDAVREATNLGQQFL